MTYVWTVGGFCYRVSVTSADNVDIGELAATILNSKIAVVTAGQIRRIGGYIRTDALLDSPDHCVIGGCTPEEFSELFLNSVQKNPST